MVKTTPRVLPLLTTVAILLSVASAVPAQSNQKCLECHAKIGLQIERDGRVVSLYVDPEVFAQSKHGKQECIYCHEDLAGVEQWPHATGLKRVDCGVCHEDDDGPIATYWRSRHGEQVKANDADAPFCQDCHGSHDIVALDPTNPKSAISPFNIPRMCGQCHAAGGVERTHDLHAQHVVERYKDSIHARGLFKQGLLHTAVCTSCHTGHNVLRYDHPESAIHKDNVVKTCMQCHGLIREVHQAVVAGVLWEREGTVPICVECHEPHEGRKVYYDTYLTNRDCLRCHGDREVGLTSDGRSLYVEPGGWLPPPEGDPQVVPPVHFRYKVTCAGCHTGVSAPPSNMIPIPSDWRGCSTITEKVDCAVCHETHVANYKRGRHGKLRVGRGDPTAPYCTDCHGVHDMLEHEVPEGASPELTRVIRDSPSFSRNVPALCARCHREGGKAAIRYFGPEENIVSHYTMSIHGKGLLSSGLTVTATCTDCHSPHKELPKSDPESTISEANIAATCGRCHDGIYEKYQLSVHSEDGNPDYETRRQRGMPKLPHCNDCHTAHTVARTDLPDFKLQIIDQCGKCHEEVTETYFETYHGKASKLGDSTRAKCYDCHGAHDILPTEDYRSRLSRENIVQTCAQCHPGSHRRFAGYLTHATHHDPEKYPALYYTFWGMTALLVGVFAFFGLHTVAWLPRSWKLRREYQAQPGVAAARRRHFVRFSRGQRQLHLAMIITFFGLAITGMMLKFSYTPWAQVLFNLLGGTDGAGMIHRICAVTMVAVFFIHLGNLWTRYVRSGKKAGDFFFGPDSLMLRGRDVKEFWATMKWFAGRGPRPAYGRWTYWEKFDYFAVFWGVAIIGSTGLVLWFPEVFTRFLPGQAINIATIVHSDEALLATGFIFTIHFFNTHFRPEKFPMDPVIFTGRVTVEELERDKPSFYQYLVESGELEKGLKEPASPSFLRWARGLGYLALVVGFLLVALIIYAMVFAYR